MRGDYFVMVFFSDGNYTPLMENDDNIAKFETREAAQKCAEENPLGENFGYEIFDIGCGV